MSALKLNRNQFTLLTYLERENTKTSKTEISENTGLSSEEINSIFEVLENEGLLEGTKITAKGYEMLEPYRVKRAVFIAAGFGSRLVPITLNTPKPLVRVNGTRMIDTLLDAVVKAGIEEIYIVRGYLGEQFDQLLYKYRGIKFIENPAYNEANNISSVLKAKKLLGNAYVFEADLVLYNPGLITKYQYTSNYLGVPVEKTDDWCFKVKDRVITKLCVGGEDCYHMFGISYWNEEDGKKLEKDIEAVFELPDGKQKYWDQVSLEYYIDNYQVEVRPCTFDDIIEIDTYNDLKKIDNSYI